MQSGVYEIRNKINGKRYVGSTGYLRRRLTEHKRHLTQGRHANSHLQAAWNYYGSAAFFFLVLEVCPLDELLDREQHHLDTASGELYNFVAHARGPRGYRHTEIAKELIGQRWRGQVRGPMTEEHRANLSASLKGRVAWNKKDHPLVSCNFCGIRFSVKPYKLGSDRGKFCSKACHHGSMRK